MRSPRELAQLADFYLAGKQPYNRRTWEELHLTDKEAAIFYQIVQKKKRRSTDFKGNRVKSYKIKELPVEGNRGCSPHCEWCLSLDSVHYLGGKVAKRRLQNSKIKEQLFGFDVD